MITIKEVSSKREMRKWCDLPLRLYKNNEYFCPAFYDDEVALYDPKGTGVNKDIAISKFFYAEKDGKIVGRVAAIINTAYNKIHNTKQGRFSRLEVEEDYEVFEKLMQVAEGWMKEMGMDNVVGPLGYHDLDTEGLLVEGFEYRCTFGSSWNFPYYADFLEKYGYTKDFDWLERRLYPPKEVSPKVLKVAQLVKQKKNYRDVASEYKRTSAFIDRYKDDIFDLLDLCYKDLPGVVPLPPPVRNSMVDQIKLILSVDYISLIVDENDKPIAFGLLFPDMVPAMQKCNGKLLPLGWYHILSSVRKPKAVELALICVHPDYKTSGCLAMILERITKNLIKADIEYAETNLNYENNNEIINLWQGYEHIQHKRKRCYKRDL